MLAKTGARQPHAKDNDEAAVPHARANYLRSSLSITTLSLDVPVKRGLPGAGVLPRGPIVPLGVGRSGNRLG